MLRLTSLAVRILFATFLMSASKSVFAQAPFWQSTVSRSDLGNADLNQTYSDLLDYLLPRRPEHPEKAQCWYVLRFVPANGPEHQVNILQIGVSTANIQTLQLEQSLSSQLTSSDDAARLAEKARVVVHARQSDNRTLMLVNQVRKAGLKVALHPEVILHGDRYEMWASCGLDRIELNVTQPAGTKTSFSDWMNELWITADHDVSMPATGSD